MMGEKEKAVWTAASHVMWMFITFIVANACGQTLVEKRAIQNNAAHYEIVDQETGRAEFKWGPRK